MVFPKSGQTGRNQRMTYFGVLYTEYRKKVSVKPKTFQSLLYIRTLPL